MKEVSPMQTATLTKSVLIVDDQLTVRQLLHEVARKAGYDTWLAENGLKALEMISVSFPCFGLNCSRG